MKGQLTINSITNVGLIARQSGCVSNMEELAASQVFHQLQPLTETILTSQQVQRSYANYGDFEYWTNALVPTLILARLMLLFWVQSVMVHCNTDVSVC